MEQRRADLVKAALEIAVEQGVSAVTTRNVCSRASAHLSVFHYCFTGKGELIDLMIRQTLLNLNERFVHADVAELPDLIKATSNLLTEEWDDAFTLYELVVASARVEKEEKDGKRNFTVLIDGVELLLSMLAERGGYRWSPDARTAAHLTVTFLAGTGIGWIADHVGEPDAEAQSAVTDTFIAMLERLQIRD